MLRTSSSSCCRVALGYTSMPSMLNASANDHWAMQGEAAMTCKELTPDRTMTLDVGCRITRMLFIQFISFSFAYFAYSLYSILVLLKRTEVRSSRGAAAAFLAIIEFQVDTSGLRLLFQTCKYEASPKWSCYVQRSIIASLEKPPQHLSPVLNLQQPLTASQEKNRCFPRKIIWA